MVVDRIAGNIKDAALGDGAADVVYLDHEELLKTHQKLTTQQGRKILLSLERGQALHCGDILQLADGTLVQIDLREEKVFEVLPETNMEFAKVAFNVGNMHQKAYLYEDCIRIPYDHTLVRTMDALGIPYCVAERKLDGIPANVFAEAQGHSHAHEHEHAHTHEHEHGHAHTHEHGDHHG